MKRQLLVLLVPLAIGAIAVWVALSGSSAAPGRELAPARTESLAHRIEQAEELQARSEPVRRQAKPVAPITPIISGVRGASENTGRPQARRATLRVSVVDPSGAAIAGATVAAIEHRYAARRARTPDDNEPTTSRVEQLTGATGTVELKLRSAVKHLVLVTHPRLATHRTIASRSHFGPRNKVVVVLKRGATLRGLVTDGGGRPRAGIHVHVSSNFGLISPARQRRGPLAAGGSSNHLALLDVASAKTDDDGTFTLRGLQDGERLYAAFGDETKLLHVDATPIVLPDEGNEYRAWTFADPTAVQGRVVDQNGRPVAGAAIWAAPKDGERESTQVSSDLLVACARSDRQGRFTLKQVSAGRYRVGLGERQNPKVRTHLSGTTVTVDVPSENEVVIELARNLFIRGSVTRSTGKAQANAIVSIEGPGVQKSLRTKANGAFTFGPLPAGEYTLRAKGVRGLGGSNTVTAVAGDHDVELQMLPSGWLRCGAVDRGKNVTARLFIVSDDASEPQMISRGASRDGPRKISVQSGRWNVFACTNDGRTGTLKRVRVGTAAEPVDAQVFLGEGAKIDIVIDGKGMRTFDIFHDGAPLLMGIPAVGSGKYPRVVPPGQITIELRDESGRVLASGSVHVAGGERRPLKLSR